MRQWLVEHAVCPVCRRALTLDPVRFVLFEGTDDRRISEGILRCAACQQDYPIVGAIPRLVPAEQLTAGERAAAEHLARHQGPPEEQLVSPPTEDEIRNELEKIVRAQYTASDSDPAYKRDWLKRQTDYLLQYDPERVKHVRTVEPCLDGPIETVLEVGGGRGGNLSVVMRETGASRGVAIEILESSCKMALLREPQTEVVRADAHALPFADGTFDLVSCAMLLEHLADWRRGLLEMARVARQGYISYSPNGAFPYDHGHLGAPVHAWMPRSLAVSVAYLFNRLRRTGRTRESVQKILETLNLVPRRRLTRFLRRHGVSSWPLFERLMHFALLVDKPYTAPGIKRMLRAYPRLAWLIGRGLTLLGAEPVVSLYFKAGRRGRNHF